jgi:hypothetical protein
MVLKITVSGARTAFFPGHTARGMRSGHHHGGRGFFSEGAMRVTRNGKVARSEAEWRTICVRFAQSGLGPQEFCQREALAVGSFKKRSFCAGASFPDRCCVMVAIVSVLLR